MGAGPRRFCRDRAEGELLCGRMSTTTKRRWAITSAWRRVTSCKLARRCETPGGLQVDSRRSTGARRARSPSNRKHGGVRLTCMLTRRDMLRFAAVSAVVPAWAFGSKGVLGGETRE